MLDLAYHVQRCSRDRCNDLSPSNPLDVMRDGFVAAPCSHRCVWSRTSLRVWTRADPARLKLSTTLKARMRRPSQSTLDVRFANQHAFGDTAEAKRFCSPGGKGRLPLGRTFSPPRAQYRSQIRSWFQVRPRRFASWLRVFCDAVFHLPAAPRSASASGRSGSPKPPLSISRPPFATVDPEISTFQRTESTRAPQREAKRFF
jgi:hypothetical protein